MVNGYLLTGGLIFICRIFLAVFAETPEKQLGWLVYGSLEIFFWLPMLILSIIYLLGKIIESL